ncbi:MAG: PAS domain-containing protein [Pyrinomonadaceae bacterium]
MNTDGQNIWPTVKYRIGKDDRLSFVNEAGRAFALENDAPELAGGDLVGRSLWDFIADPETREVYRMILARVRAGRTVELDVRCDAPDVSRLLRLAIRRHDDDEIEFECSTLAVAPRPREASLIDRGARRARDWVVIVCSWCKRVQTPRTGQWVEIDDAVRDLGLLAREVLPGLSHGICRSCRERVSEFV